MTDENEVVDVIGEMLVASGYDIVNGEAHYQSDIALRGAINDWLAMLGDDR
jgi:hypothetical protein